MDYMVFSYQITTPANTTEKLPLRTTLNLSRGIIHNWSLLFPSGNWAEHRIRIMHGSEFILPHNPDSFLAGDGAQINLDDMYLLLSEPYDLQIISWNLDDINPHTVYVTISLKPVWTFFPTSLKFIELMDQEEIRRMF